MKKKEEGDWDFVRPFSLFPKRGGGKVLNGSKWEEEESTAIAFFTSLCLSGSKLFSSSFLPLLLYLSLSRDLSFLFFALNLLSLQNSVVEFSSFISFLYLNIFSQMDGKKNNNRSSSSSSSSATSEGKVARKTSHSGLFNSVFPPLMDRKESSHSEIFGPPRKQEECLNHVWSNAYKEGNTSKAYKKTTTTTALYGSERSDPSNLSDSLYYGGQDIYSETSQTSQSTYDKKDGEDNTGSSDYASRGNWWQGSLYY